MNGRKRRIALKYCGGCDSTYDRVQYWQEIRDAGAGTIEWVTLDDPPFTVVLLINGCEKACKEQEFAYPHGVTVLSVRNNKRDPLEIAEILLSLKYREKRGVS